MGLGWGWVGVGLEPSTHESHGVNTAWIQPEGSSSDWPYPYP